MKVFTTGILGRVPAPLAGDLGISTASNHRQARILVAAPNKQTAHALLTDRGLDVAMGNREFMTAYGDDVACLRAAGLLDQPIVLAHSHTNGPVARVDTDGYLIIGTYTAAHGDADSVFTPTRPVPDSPTTRRTPMKLYSLGNHGRVTDPVARALRLSSNRQQAEVMVSARSKAAAFARLCELGMDPGSIHDREFRVDEGYPGKKLLAAGQFATSHVVLVMQLTSSNTPVVRIDTKTTFTVVGDFVRGQFVPTERPVALPAAPAPADEDPALLGAMLTGVNRALNQVSAELIRKRAERAELCRRAVAAGLVAEAAAALDVTPAFVYQLQDRALRARAATGHYLPGLWVEIEDPDLPPAKWSIAQVVDTPPDAIAPDADSLWMWVHTNDNTFPVRQHRLRPWTAPCTECPPQEQLTIRTSAALLVHQQARHSGM